MHVRVLLYSLPSYLNKEYLVCTIIIFLSYFLLLLKDNGLKLILKIFSFYFRLNQLCFPFSLLFFFFMFFRFMCSFNLAIICFSFVCDTSQWSNKAVSIKYSYHKNISHFHNLNKKKKNHYFVRYFILRFQNNS